KAEDVDPGTIIETDRVHDQRVAFPPAGRVAVPRWSKIVEVLARRHSPSVHPKLPERSLPLEELNPPSLRLDDSPRFRIEEHPREAVRVAFVSGVVSVRGHANGSDKPGMLAV